MEDEINKVLLISKKLAERTHKSKHKRLYFVLQEALTTLKTDLKYYERNPDAIPEALL
jgi:hypothetical protein